MFRNHFYWLLMLPLWPWGSPLIRSGRDEHPICYYSKKLDGHQKKYSIVEKETLGLILAVRTFSVYFGSSPVRVYTDHSPLQFLQRMSTHNQKLLRWSLELDPYNLDVRHRPGKENTIPDLLSRPVL